MPKKKSAKNKKPKKRKKPKRLAKKSSPKPKIRKRRTKNLLGGSFNEVHRTRMKIIGIGGGGSSIVSEIAPQISRVDFVVANTDVQALKESVRRARKIHFGQNITFGLGCGMEPKLGQKAAKEEKSKIAKLFKGVDLTVIVSSLGGGTGSGAAPEFAKIAKDLGVLTLGIFTLPFKFEGSRRSQIAKSSLERLTPNLNVISIIPNENIFKVIDKNTPLKTAFSSINKRLAENLRGLIEMVYLPGLINIDFADLKTILDGRGKLAYLNTAVAQGPNRAEEAVKELLKSPLNEYTVQGAEKIIFNITASHALGMQEVEHISRTISDFNKRAKIIFGVSQDNNYKDKIRITLLAVGVGREQAKKKPQAKKNKKPIPQEIPEPETKKIVRKKIKHKKKIVSQKPIAKLKQEKNREVKRILNSAPPPEKKKEAQKESAEKIEIVVPKPLMRKSALELKKETEKTEEELLDQEKKWDIPAFLRKRGNE